MDAEIVCIAPLTILASVVGTITGFGISTIMMPVLLIFIPLPETLLLVGIIHWFGDSFIGASLSLTVPHDILSRAQEAQCFRRRGSTAFWPSSRRLLSARFSDGR